MITQSTFEAISYFEQKVGKLSEFKKQGFASTLEFYTDHSLELAQAEEGEIPCEDELDQRIQSLIQHHVSQLEIAIKARKDESNLIFKHQYQDLLNRLQICEKQYKSLLREAENYDEDKKLKLKSDLKEAQRGQDRCVTNYHSEMLIFQREKQQRYKVIVADLFSDLNQLVVDFEDLINKRRGLSDSSYEKYKEVLALRINRLIAIGKVFQDRIDDLNEQIRNLPTLPYNLASRLSWAGNAGIVIAGWLFALFAMNSSITTVDPFEIFVKSLNNLVAGAMIGMPPLVKIGILSGIVLGLIIVVGLLGWMAEWLIKKLGIEESKDEYMKLEDQFELGEKGKGHFLSVALKSSTFLGFWLKIAPFLFLSSLAIILVFIGNSRDVQLIVTGSVSIGSDPLSGLFNALSGQLLGSTLAALFAGIFILYTEYLIFPRLKKKDNTPRTYKDVWKQIWEIPISIMVLVVVLITWTIAAMLGIDTPEAKCFFSLFGYLGVVMVTGVIIGLSIKYESIRKEEVRLGTIISGISRAKEKYAGPRPTFSTTQTQKKFSKSYTAIEDEIYAIYWERIRALRIELSGGKWFSHFGQNSSKIIKKMYHWIKGQRYISLTLPRLSHLEAKHFPAQYSKIEDLRLKHYHLGEEEERLRDELKALNNNLSQKKKEFEKQLEEAKTAFEKLNDQIHAVQKEHATQNEGWDRFSQLATTAIMEGAITARWLIHNPTQYLPQGYAKLSTKR